MGSEAIAHEAEVNEINKVNESVTYMSVSTLSTAYRKVQSVWN